MFDPYHRWLAIPPDLRPPTHYALLGVSRHETDPDVIRDAAIRQTTHLRTYQSGPYATECAKLLNEVANARRNLLDPEKRTEYDATLEHAEPLPKTHSDQEPPETGEVAAKTQGLTLEASLDRILSNTNDFGSLFYFTIFLQRYPEIADYFRGVDFQRQPARLLSSLIIIVYHYRRPNPSTDLYLRELGRNHHSLGIPTRFYDSFRDALLETLERIHQDEWHAELADQWQQAIDSAAQSMLNG